MNYLIIKSHPYKNSFNAGLANAIKETLEHKGSEVDCIDLVEDKFNPVMSSEALRLWRQGQTNDSIVKKYQTAIQKVDILIFPFPVWWGAMPAILKGFCDKVLLKDFAYKYAENGEMIGLLNSKKSVVITTMETPSNIFESYFNNPVEGAFIKDTLQTCGIEVLKHFEIDGILSGGKEYASAKMDEIIKFFKETEN